MYWEEFPKPAPRPKPKAGKARKKFGTTWWGKNWVELLSEYEYDQRMSRGRAYARADRVHDFKIKKGAITAKVKGSSNYKVHITIKEYTNKEWDKIISALSNTPIIISKLLNNQMPEDLLDITGYSFIPETFEAQCNCPDFTNPCKHMAAVFYTIADEIDYNPMILFTLRGMEKQEILTKLGITDPTSQTEHKEKLNKKATKKKKTRK